jgi:hypothetical protein
LLIPKQEVWRLRATQAERVDELYSFFILGDFQTVCRLSAHEHDFDDNIRKPSCYVSTGAFLNLHAMRMQAGPAGRWDVCQTKVETPAALFLGQYGL